MGYIRRLMITLALLALNSLLYAGGAEELDSHSTLSGLYLGEHVGAIFSNFTLKSISKTSINSNVSNFANNEHAENFTAGIELGFGHQFQHSFLGGYIQAQYYNLHTSSSGTIFFTGATPVIEIPDSFNVSLQSSAGLGIKPGIILSENTLLFIQVGALWSTVNYKTSYNPFDLGRGLFRNDTINSQNKFILGGEIGLGIEEHIKTNLSFFFEYFYDYFGQVRKTINNNPSETDRRSQFTQYTLSTSQLRIGMNYYFTPDTASYNKNNLFSPRDFNLVFLGIYGGADWLFVNSNQYILNTGIPSPAIYWTIRHGSGNWSGFGALTIGFGCNITLYYFGVVLHADLNRHSWSTASVEGRSTGTRSLGILTRLNQRQYGGVDIKLGYFMQQKTLVYLKVGGQCNKFSLINDSDRLHRSYNTISAQSASLTVEYGLGIEQMLSKHLTLFVEDNYTSYKKLIIQATPTTTTDPQTSTILVRPQSNKLIVGINIYL